MQLDRTSFVFQVALNVTVFFATIVIVYWITTFGMGWNPEKKLAEGQKRLSLLQIFLLVMTVTLLSSILCFSCSPLKDGVVSGFLFVVILKAFYHWNSVSS